ncbi:myeloid-associated differentiation marker-like protein 2 [Conger conger]|uniref:myeloid-associated differentiation marker-like protein 2 n=1 Tax=Conger conger TaxID=82655 RepID=UPI002A59FA9A|nr:myeloid-associated differentiation marker-like protein 2 [Conger conger]
MDKISFTPSALTSGRGILHIIEIVLCAVDSGLLSIYRHPSHTYWVWCMFTWVFCGIMTLIITIIEMFKIDLLLKFLNIMDWDDFATGMTLTMTLMVFSTAIIYPVFYICSRCFLAVAITIVTLVCLIVYIADAVKSKCATKGSYLCILPGFIKVLEAFVTCMIFISLTGYVGKPALYWCILVYIVPFPVTLLFILINILYPLKSCLCCDLKKFAFYILLVIVLLYISAAIIWPVYSFRGNPRPADCPGNFCIWNILFIVTFMTYVNLFLYILDCIFTKLGICGF